MTEGTVALLSALHSCEWFRAVGQPVPEGNAITVGSWGEAVRLCRAKKWENVQIATANILTEALWQHWPDRFRQWNEVVAELRKEVAPLVLRKVQRAVRENNLPDIFVASVRWDVLHLALEAEYSDLIPLGFYYSLSNWYKLGHFPCGWEGSWPTGTIIVY